MKKFTQREQGRLEKILVYDNEHFVERQILQNSKTKHPTERAKQTEMKQNSAKHASDKILVPLESRKQNVNDVHSEQVDTQTNQEFHIVVEHESGRLILVRFALLIFPFPNHFI